MTCSNQISSDHRCSYSSRAAASSAEPARGTAARRRWLLDVFTLLLFLVVLAVYGWTSLEVIDAMEGIPFTSIPVTQPVLYWSLPVGAALMAVAFIVRLREHAKKPPAGA